MNTELKMNTEHAYESNALVPVEQFPFQDIDDVFARAKAKIKTEVNAADAWREILFWIFFPTRDKVITRRKKTIVIRLYAMAWSVMPEMFEGKSLTDVAASIDVLKQTLSSYVVEFSQLFGYVSRGMKTEEARANYRIAAKMRRAEKKKLKCKSPKKFMRKKLSELPPGKESF